MIVLKFKCLYLSTLHSCLGSVNLDDPSTGLLFVLHHVSSNHRFQALSASSSHSFKGLDLFVDCAVLDGRGQSLVLLDGQADTLLSRKRLAVLLVRLSDIDEHGLEVAGVGDWVT